MMPRTTGKRQAAGLRGGFTILETSVALALLGLALVTTTQLAVWVLSERGRGRDQQAAAELAANVLESARACRWEDLTPAWAAAQRLPGVFQEDGWQLAIRVAPEPSQPEQLKRVTVVVRPAARKGGTALPVEMMTFLAARGDVAKGDKP
jgi:prepilin-type N-terminal cleavage/methylation domain-containing protein